MNLDWVFFSLNKEPFYLQPQLEKKIQIFSRGMAKKKKKLKIYTFYIYSLEADNDGDPKCNVA